MLQDNEIQDHNAPYNYHHHDMYHLFYEFDNMTRHITNILNNKFHEYYREIAFQEDTFDTLWRSANSAIIDHMLLGVK